MRVKGGLARGGGADRWGPTSTADSDTPDPPLLGVSVRV